MSEGKISELRNKYHRKLVDTHVLTVDESGIPSNADRASRLSVEISRNIAEELHALRLKKETGQTVGSRFEIATMEFIRDSFRYVNVPYRYSWHIVRLGNTDKVMKLSDFTQYQHLDFISKLAENTPSLAASLGLDYMVNPDIVMFRDPLGDSDLNSEVVIVDSTSSLLADIRKNKQSLPFLHASISTKWTMRSDRAQNSRTEALNLIRNRKGHLPHIVAVTGEPMPGRIASIALGTGDIDCVYHFALYELVEAVKETGAEDSIEMLNTLITGKRLKDISDLPLDLML